MSRKTYTCPRFDGGEAEWRERKRQALKSVMATMDVLQDGIAYTPAHRNYVRMRGNLERLKEDFKRWKIS